MRPDINVGNQWLNKTASHIVSIYEINPHYTSSKLIQCKPCLLELT